MANRRNVTECPPVPQDEAAGVPAVHREQVEDRHRRRFLPCQRRYSAASCHQPPLQCVKVQPVAVEDHCLGRVRIPCPARLPVPKPRSTPEEPARAFRNRLFRRNRRLLRRPLVLWPAPRRQPPGRQPGWRELHRSGQVPRPAGSPLLPPGPAAPHPVRGTPTRTPPSRRTQPPPRGSGSGQRGDRQATPHRTGAPTPPGCLSGSWCPCVPWRCSQRPMKARHRIQAEKFQSSSPYGESSGT